MLTLLFAAITISTSFEGGNIGKVETLAPAHLRCAVKGQADQNNRNRQASWYYFQLGNLPKREVTIDFVDLAGEYNFKAGTHPVTKNTRPVYSYDQRTWTHFEDHNVEWDEKELRLTLRFTPGQEKMWIAHIAPYTAADLARIPSSPFLRREVIGKTVKKRDMPLFTVTDPSVPLDSKKVVWVMARQHAWETGTSWVIDGALRFLLSAAPEADAIRRSTVFKIFPMADPDGVATGAVRFNANGYDLNRNWDAIDAQLMPEIAAQRKVMLDWLDSGKRIDLFLALHNTETQDFIEAPLTAGGTELQAIAHRFQKLLDEQTTFHAPKGPRSSGTTTTPGMKGRMTVYQALLHERKVPAFLMEQMVERSPRLGHPPTVQDRLNFGAALVGVLANTPAPNQSTK